MSCEYHLECGFAEEQTCKYEGSEESCPLWKDYSVRAKINRNTTRLNAVAKEVAQINLEVKA